MKQKKSKDLTDDGMVMLVKPTQSSKHHLPKNVTDELIVMLVNPLQFEKQESSSLETEEGMTMLFRLMQPQYLQVVLYQLLVC